jgi:hypothetical protein
MAKKNQNEDQKKHKARMELQQTEILRKGCNT